MNTPAFARVGEVGEVIPPALPSVGEVGEVGPLDLSRVGEVMTLSRAGEAVRPLSREAIVFLSNLSLHKNQITEYVFCPISFIWVSDMRNFL